MSRPGIGFGRVMSCCLGQVLVFAFVLVLVFVIVLVKFSAVSTLHKPHHLSLQLSVPCRIPIFKFLSFSRASDKCEKVAEIQSPASERGASHLME